MMDSPAYTGTLDVYGTLFQAAEDGDADAFHELISHYNRRLHAERQRNETLRRQLAEAYALTLRASEN